MKTQLIALGSTLAAVAVAVAATVSLHSGAGHPAPALGPAQAAPTGPVNIPAEIAGVVSDNLTAFDSTCGCHPNVAVHYARWGDPPASSRKLAAAMAAAGASPMLEISPTGTTLSAVTADRTDTWLRSYALMVRSLKISVLMSFAPEANGNWYPWGWTHVQPAAEVAAWRHVVTVFRQAGAANARWVWIVNQTWPGAGPLPKLWPGPAYVDMIGIDGYFRKASDTFGSVFVPTITAVRRFAPGTPLLVTETGASPQAGKARAVRELAGGARRYRLDGFVWFDIDQGPTGPSHSDWSLEHAPAALAEYRQDVVTTTKTR